MVDEHGERRECEVVCEDDANPKWRTHGALGGMKSLYEA
jgi:hypothetical protein